MKNKLIVVNVLDKNYYDDCHIVGSINIYHKDFAAFIPALDPENIYVLYCARYMCSASSSCAQLLLQAGFKHVFAYEGGIAEWYQKGYPYQGPATVEFLKGDNPAPTEHGASELSIMSAEELLGKMKECGVIPS